MARLLLGVSGGIAAYKAVETARLAVKAGHAVRVIVTQASTNFVGPASFEAITGGPVLCDEFDSDPARGAYPGEPVPDRIPISHLALAQRAQLYLIAPASANTVAKLAHGHADNLLSAAALAARCPVAAMNDEMYRHPATQSNLQLLSSRGVTVIEPEVGELASHGEHGVGRLPEPVRLLDVCESLLGAAQSDTAHAPLLGCRVLVTAGGTREPIDSVRFIGNRSSGRMGFALAEQAGRRGADVTLIAANVALAPPSVARLLQVQTAAQLAAACEREFIDCDVLLMAAAVADFRPRGPAQYKLKKSDGAPLIEFEQTEDILATLAARTRSDQVIVGFAAEHGTGAIAEGAAKLQRKRLDAIVVNDISEPGIGFDAADNEVTILTASGGRHHVGRASKELVAGVVLDEVQQLLADKERDDRASRAHPDRAARV